MQPRQDNIALIVRANDRGTGSSNAALSGAIGDLAMTRAQIKGEAHDREICRLNEEFHGVAGKLADAFVYATSDKSEDHIDPAHGKAVAITRQMIALDEKLTPLGWSHEGAYRKASATVRNMLDGKRRRVAASQRV